MNRESLKKTQRASKAKRSPAPKPAKPRARASVIPSGTHALRIQAQIAMLKRALLAADDDTLPHKAVCDYLQTLSQMAKVEASGAIESSDPRQAEANAEADGDSIPVDGPFVGERVRQREDVKRLLRRTVRDIYGLPEIEPTETVPSDAAAGEGDNATT